MGPGEAPPCFTQLSSGDAPMPLKGPQRGPWAHTLTPKTLAGAEEDRAGQTEQTWLLSLLPTPWGTASLIFSSPAYLLWMPRKEAQTYFYACYINDICFIFPLTVSSHFYTFLTLADDHFLLVFSNLQLLLFHLSILFL